MEPPVAEGNLFDWLGISGLISLIASAIGFGKLQQKIDWHAAELEKVKANADTLARLDERLAHVKQDVAEIKESLRAR
jgi:hypothetical protein